MSEGAMRRDCGGVTTTGSGLAGPALYAIMNNLRSELELLPPRVKPRYFWLHSPQTKQPLPWA